MIIFKFPFFPTTDMVDGEQRGCQGVLMKKFLKEVCKQHRLLETLQLIHFCSCYLGTGLLEFDVWPGETDWLPNMSAYLSGMKGMLYGELDSPNVLMMINKFRYLWKNASDTQMVLNRISKEWHQLGQSAEQFVYIYVKGPKKFKRLFQKKN